MVEFEFYNLVEQWDIDLNFHDSGIIVSVGDGTAVCIGLEDVASNELVLINKAIYGVSMNLQVDSVGIVFFGSDRLVGIGDTVERTYEIISISLDENYLGRVIDSLGNFVDGLSIVESIVDDEEDIENDEEGIENDEEDIENDEEDIENDEEDIENDEEELEAEDQDDDFDSKDFRDTVALKCKGIISEFSKEFSNESFAYINPKGPIVEEIDVMDIILDADNDWIIFESEKDEFDLYDLIADDYYLGSDVGLYDWDDSDDESGEESEVNDFFIEEAQPLYVVTQIDPYRFLHGEKTQKEI